MLPTFKDREETHALWTGTLTEAVGLRSVSRSQGRAHTNHHHLPEFTVAAPLANTGQVTGVLSAECPNADRPRLGPGDCSAL